MFSTDELSLNDQDRHEIIFLGKGEWKIRVHGHF